MISNRHVIVTGLGFVTCLGHSRQDVVDHLKTGTHGIRSVSFGDGQAPIKVAGTPPDYHFPSTDAVVWQLPPESRFNASALPGMAPHGVFAFDALSQAISRSRHLTVRRSGRNVAPQSNRRHG